MSRPLPLADVTVTEAPWRTLAARQMAGSRLALQDAVKKRSHGYLERFGIVALRAPQKP